MMSDEAARLLSEEGVLTTADGPPTADQTPLSESPVVPLDQPRKTPFLTSPRRRNSTMKRLLPCIAIYTTRPTVAV